MDEEDKSQFGKLLVTTAELFEKDLSAPVINMYFTALKTHSIGQVQDALAKVVTSCKFFPRPVEIIEFIGGGPGKLEDIAQVQADLVINAIRKIGSYRSVGFKDPVTTAVIQQSFGGWIKICLELMETSEKWFRKDFINSYQAYFRQGIKSNGHLAGLIETDNMTRGHLEFIPDPVMVEGVEILRIALKN